LKSFTVVETAE